MAKVTINPAETPTQAIVRAANQVITVTDANGHSIGIKKMGPLDRLKLFEVVGPENSKNEAYLGYASLAFHVQSIDSEAVPRPATKIQLEALVQRLDDDGINAVALGVAEHFMPKESAETDGAEALKNR